MATTTKLTLEQFLEREETEPASEYEDGEVTQKAMPSIGHGWVQRLLAFALTLYLRANPGRYAGSEVRCIFGPRGHRRAYVPDSIFISAERRGSWKLDGPFRAAPDLAIEILSPGDRMSRVLRKIRFSLENGVRQVWLIDPMRRTIEV